MLCKRYILSLGNVVMRIAINIATVAIAALSHFSNTESIKDVFYILALLNLKRLT